MRVFGDFRCEMSCCLIVKKDMQRELIHAEFYSTWFKSRCVLHLRDLSHVTGIFENLYNNEQNVTGEEQFPKKLQTRAQSRPKPKPIQWHHITSFKHFLDFEKPKPSAAWFLLQLQPLHTIDLSLSNLTNSEPYRNGESDAGSVSGERRTSDVHEEQMERNGWVTERSIWKHWNGTF